jgi:hypothetical protein
MEIPTLLNIFDKVKSRITTVMSLDQLSIGILSADIGAPVLSKLVQSSKGESSYTTRLEICVDRLSIIDQ